ncbi:MAG TPA: hypothetical protein VH054_21990 [Polyangiaceae bacterium]|jgi:hypothetical protein|nr:hypothetical protein [Polyangiaceae bacterium]
MPVKAPTTSRSVSAQHSAAAQCSICTSPRDVRDATDRRLLSQEESLAKIASDTPFSKSALGRHGKHIYDELARLRLAETTRLLNKIGNNYEERLALLDKFMQSLLIEVREKSAENPGAQIKILDSMRKVVESIAKIRGDLKTGITHTHVNIISSPDWQIVQKKILAALEAHPAARIAVAKALEASNG